MLQALIRENNWIRLKLKKPEKETVWKKFVHEFPSKKGGGLLFGPPWK